MIKKSLAFLLILVLILVGMPAAAMAEEILTVNSIDQLKTLDDSIGGNQQIVVIYKEKQPENIQTLELSKSEVEAGESVSNRVDVLQVADDVNISDLLEELRSQPNVLAADINQISKKSSLPNDNYIQSGDAWQFEAIGADSTWDQVTNSEAIVVAVLDTGLNINHPDLIGKTVPGYDYVAGTIEVTDRDRDEEGHGTMVSGCIVAAANNEIGAAGVTGNANVKVAPYCIGDGSFSDSYIAAALMDAADRDEIAVINMSYGGYYPSKVEQAAIDYAFGKGKILVASSGNEGAGSEAGMYSYPASYQGVISVGATTINREITEFSQYNDQVDLVAPGERIVTTEKSGGYCYADGTSFSAPIVAGACAVLKAADASLSSEEVETVLKETALDLGVSGKDEYFGNGLIQLDQALTAVIDENDNDSKVDRPEVYYRTNIQNIGLQDYVSDGDLSGTEGLGLRLEGLEVRLETDYDLNIEYTTHVQNQGWQEYATDGQLAGTKDLGLRLEAVRIRLTGTDAELFDIYYRVHAQNVGWMGWAKNGADSGTAGFGYRLEGIEIVLLPAGSNPPGVTEGAYLAA